MQQVKNAIGAKLVVSMLLVVVSFFLLIETMDNFEAAYYKQRHKTNINKTVKLPTLLKKTSSVENLPERIQLLESNNSEYFTPRANGIGCYTLGSVHPEPGMEFPCQCRQGYYGPSCSIPEVVMTSACQTINNCESIKVRDKPRRIIHAFNVHHEYNHIEVQLGQLADVVDVFIIGESNRTTSGEPNDLKVLPKMKEEGFMEEYQHKIIYVTMLSNYFPEDPTGGGWKTDVFIRDFMGELGLNRIDGQLDTEIFVFTIVFLIYIIDVSITCRYSR